MTDEELLIPGLGEGATGHVQGPGVGCIGALAPDGKLTFHIQDTRIEVVSAASTRARVVSVPNESVVVEVNDAAGLGHHTSASVATDEYIVRSPDEQRSSSDIDGSSSPFIAHAKVSRCG